MILRPATEADAEPLRELVLAAYSPYVGQIGGEPRPMTDDYLEVVRRGRTTVAEDEGRVVGLVVLAIEDGLPWIDNVAVDASVRGTGIGAELLRHAEATARAEGHSVLRLLTHELMEDNLALYSRIGYAEFGRRELGDGKSLVLMEKPLD